MLEEKDGVFIIKGNAVIEYLENKNLELKNQLDNVIRESNNALCFNDSSDYEMYLWRCLAYAKGYEYKERYDKENQTYKWEWEDLLEEIKI